MSTCHLLNGEDSHQCQKDIFLHGNGEDSLQLEEDTCQPIILEDFLQLDRVNCLSMSGEFLGLKFSPWLPIAL